MLSRQAESRKTVTHAEQIISIAPTATKRYRPVNQSQRRFL